MMMYKRIFLQGNIGSGKTSLIIKKIKPFIKETGGFCIQRLMEGDAFRAFRIVPVTEELELVAPYKAGLDGIFMYEEKGVFKTDIDSFITAAAGLLDGFIEKKLIVMDEIGGIELLNEQFLKLVKPVFESGVPCIGVVKSERNAEAMAKELGLHRDYWQARRRFIADIERTGKIYTLSDRSRKRIGQAIDTFLSRIPL